MPMSLVAASLLMFALSGARALYRTFSAVWLTDINHVASKHRILESWLVFIAAHGLFLTSLNGLVIHIQQDPQYIQIEE